jgi:hypothetical protein
MCNDTTLKELLASYREQKLDTPEQVLVENHVASCKDCRLELSLLGMMAELPVPEPGDLFWTTMPGLVYSAVQEQKRQQRNFGIAWLLDRVTLPRWALASATMVAVLMLSWFFMRPVPDMVPTQAYEFDEEIMPGDRMQVAELSGDELVTLDTWAGTALASIAKETEQVMGSVQDTDIYEEVAELDAREGDQLLKMIDERTKEVSS